MRAAVDAGVIVHSLGDHVTHSRRFLCAVAALQLASAAANTASAQRSDQATIPRDLAAAFVRMYVPNDTTSVVDFTPDSIPLEIGSIVELPPGARLLGTVSVGKTAYVLGTASSPADSVLAWYARQAAQHHWSAEALVRATGNPLAGGFRPAPPVRPTIFCANGTGLDVAAKTVAGVTTFRVRVSPNGFPCTIPTIAFRPIAPRSPLPTLYNPVNASTSVQCYSSGPRQATQTQLVVEMTPTELLQHYAQQLEKQGWLPMQGEFPVVTQSWSRRDSSGVTEVATLTIGVSPTAPMCRNGTLDVTTLRSR